MELLAQVDCSALKSLPDFPHTGLLQFFIGTDECYGADFDDMTSQKGFCVLYHETVDVSVTEEEVLAKRPENGFVVLDIYVSLTLDFIYSATSSISG